MFIVVLTSECPRSSCTSLREVKEIYTNLINRHIFDPEQQLKVFDKNSVYLPTKKIGKNNPKAATKEQRRSPEKQSVLKHLREMQDKNRQKPPQRQRKKYIDRNSR